MTYADYIELWTKALANWQLVYQRPGQLAFNVLAETRPDLADPIRATTIDPFYDDDRLEDFFTALKVNW